MLGERDAQLDAEEHASGEKPVWRRVYNFMRCDSSTCQHGPHCWVDEVGEKHYPIKAYQTEVFENSLPPRHTRFFASAPLRLR
jgi:hypothetical protein